MTAEIAESSQPSHPVTPSRRWRKHEAQTHNHNLQGLWAASLAHQVAAACGSLLDEQRLAHATHRHLASEGNRQSQLQEVGQEALGSHCQTLLESDAH